MQSPSTYLFSFYVVHSLENLVKSLQAKGTSSLITENGNNVVTITTAHSSTRMNNNNESGGPTHHDTIPKPQRATQIKMVSTPNVKTSNGNGNGGGGGGGGAPILSGPVTDL